MYCMPRILHAKDNSGNVLDTTNASKVKFANRAISISPKLELIMALISI